MTQKEHKLCVSYKHTAQLHHIQMTRDEKINDIETATSAKICQDAISLKGVFKIPVLTHMDTHTHTKALS